VTDDGEILLGPGVGNIPSLAHLADKIVIELNEHIPAEIRGLHDIYMPLDPPYRREIPIYKPSDRIGSPVLKVDPSKIVGIIKTYNTDKVHGFSPIDETTMRIGANVCKFLIGELRAGRIPKEFLPLQSGVGNIANAVLHGLEESPEIPQFDMYTEVIQDAVLDLMEKGKCRFSSTCSLTFSDETMDRFFKNVDFFRDKVLIRPGEISNNPEIIRRLGVISMNTALEADIFGNINSTHVLGTSMMNGIGGSGDFNRNLVVGAANSTGLHFNDRLHVADGGGEHFECILASLLFDLGQRAVDDAFGNRLLAVDHHDVHELGQFDVAELRIRQYIAFRYFSASWHNNLWIFQFS
jgi:acyl-CoA hydrolase